MRTVIAVAAPPGAGKTTFAAALARRLGDAVTVDFDSYRSLTERAPQEVMRWLAAGADCDAVAVPRLAADLARLKAGEGIVDPLTGAAVEARRHVIFETPFGRAHAATARHIDLLLWIDVPLDVALARNLAEMTRMFLADGALSGDEHRRRLEWLAGYLDNYLGFVRGALALQRRRVAAGADIVLDGDADSEAMAARAAAEIGARIG